MGECKVLASTPTTPDTPRATPPPPPPRARVAPPTVDAGHAHDLPNSDSESGHARNKRRPKKRVRKSKKSTEDSGDGPSIAITRQQKVQELVHLTDVPSVWKVAKTRNEIAYYVDKTNDTREWKKDGGDEMTMASYILNKSQDSWHGKSKGGQSKGTGGSLKTTVKVPALGGVECRYVTRKCSGSLMCSQADKSQLDGCMRFDDDTEQTREQWNAERSVNAQDSSSAKSRAISFWRSTSKKRCGALILDGTAEGNLILCGGTPVVRKFSAASRARNRDGKTMFIGCSHSEIGDRKEHQCYWIPRDVNEILVEELWKPNGNLDTLPSTGGEDSLVECARIIHPRSGEKGAKECPYSHTKDGQPIIGIMEGT
ncbi:hypothetical protein FA13DRAFT_1798554 [Coprinellus micaceus]|uniref:WW domain-containing protein n=1 Tax=Coprinellus micaceus TaxID=71717 RepID=A0A4Y7SLS3_COPMI|nr:hypothetical protein FA13DRAFT_1798554 [Coprinellus micaceus]